MRTLLLVLATTLSLVCSVPAGAEQTQAFSLLKLSGLPTRWAGSGSGPVVITYAFAKRSTLRPASRNCQAIGALDGLLERSQLSVSTLHREVRAAFDLWEAAANVRFVETSDPERADIVIGAQLKPEWPALTDITQRAGGSGEIKKAVICLDATRHWKVGFDGNLNVYDLRYTLTHEIGHAIGLDHPQATDEVMSPRYSEEFRTLQPGDRSGAVALYGPNPAAPQTPTPSVAQSSRRPAASMSQNAARVHS